MPVSLLAWAILVVLILGAAFAAVILVDRSRSARLRSRFGPEYERTLQETGNRRSTERRLAGVARRRDSLDIQPLPAERRTALRAQWASLQALFVDEPATATIRADELVTTVLRDRGYPTDDRAETAGLLAADTPALGAGFREARVGMTGAEAGDADTDTLRRRFLALRAVFDNVVAPAAAPAGAPADTPGDPSATEPSAASADAGSAAPASDDPTAREAAISSRRQRS